MKKTRLCFALFLLICLLVSCAADGEDESVAASAADTSVQMTATVVRFLDPDKLEVDVIEGDYGASGPYWVILSEETAFYGKDGTPVKSADIKEGATVKILYGGQVMMSYPPQIVAGSITLCE